MKNYLETLHVLTEKQVEKDAKIADLGCKTEKLQTAISLFRKAKRVLNSKRLKLEKEREALNRRINYEILQMRALQQSRRVKIPVEKS